MEGATPVKVKDLRQSEEYGNFMRKTGWKIVQSNGSNIFVKRLGPVGIAKIQRCEGNLNWQIIEKLFMTERIMMCIIEPADRPVNRGFKINKEPLLGTKTLRVDLCQPEGKIFQSFKKDARYCINRCTGLQLKPVLNDFSNFYLMWKKSAKRKKLWIPSFTDYQRLVSSFGENAFCITVEDLAGAVILINKGTAFYYYAGGTKTGTRMNVPYFVVWTAMKEARKRGCKIWDFEGIYDTRWPNKGWLGFTHFKKSFGGVEYEFPGSYIKWRWPFQLLPASQSDR
jgi:hypothetical protein